MLVESAAGKAHSDTANEQFLRLPPIVQRNGGVTRVVVNGVALEVLHGNLAGRGSSGAGGTCGDGNAEDSDDGNLEMLSWFFEEGFSLASATGFARVWPGGAALVRALSDTSDPVRQAIDVARAMRSAAAADACSSRRHVAARCVELGAGCGLVGLAAAAAAGADVLLTDTAPVVHGVLVRNLKHNAAAGSNGNGSADTSARVAPWPGAERVGRGSVAASVLDWTRPVRDQLSGVAACPDVVLAAECVWLAELVEPFADAAAALLLGHSQQGQLPEDDEKSSRPEEHLLSSLPVPVLFLSSRERAKAGSASFAHVNAALSALASRGCGDCTLVAQYAPGGEHDDGDEEGPLFVYAVRPDKGLRGRH